jgi:hypothetical protein
LLRFIFRSFYMAICFNLWFTVFNHAVVFSKLMTDDVTQFRLRYIFTNMNPRARSLYVWTIREFTTIVSVEDQRKLRANLRGVMKFALESMRTPRPMPTTHILSPCNNNPVTGIYSMIWRSICSVYRPAREERVRKVCHHHRVKHSRGNAIWHHKWRWRHEAHQLLPPMPTVLSDGAGVRLQSWTSRDIWEIGNGALRGNSVQSTVVVGGS